MQAEHGAVALESKWMEVGSVQRVQPYAESMPLSRQLSCSDPLGHKPKVSWPFQASFSCQEPFHSLLLFLNLLPPQDPVKTALWNHSDVEESTDFHPEGHMFR